MSYCRFSKDSDMYVFNHVDGYLTCFACKLNGPGEHKVRDDWDVHEKRVYKRNQIMLEHCLQHEKVGHKVPKRLIKRLKEEMVRCMEN